MTVGIKHPRLGAGRLSVACYLPWGISFYIYPLQDFQKTPPKNYKGSKRPWAGLGTGRGSAERFYALLPSGKACPLLAPYGKIRAANGAAGN